MIRAVIRWHTHALCTLAYTRERTCDPQRLSNYRVRALRANHSRKAIRVFVLSITCVFYIFTRYRDFIWSRLSKDLKIASPERFNFHIFRVYYVYVYNLTITLARSRALSRGVYEGSRQRDVWAGGCARGTKAQYRRGASLVATYLPI
jgi:hypothetical protein